VCAAHALYQGLYRLNRALQSANAASKGSSKYEAKVLGYMPPDAHSAWLAAWQCILGHRWERDGMSPVLPIALLVSSRRILLQLKHAGPDPWDVPTLALSPLPSVHSPQ
jgi:hypothetical protein